MTLLTPQSPDTPLDHAPREHAGVHLAQAPLQAIGDETAQACEHVLQPSLPSLEEVVDMLTKHYQPTDSEDAELCEALMAPKKKKPPYTSRGKSTPLSRTKRKIETRFSSNQEVTRVIPTALFDEFTEMLEESDVDPDSFPHLSEWCALTVGEAFHFALSLQENLVNCELIAEENRPFGSSPSATLNVLFDDNDLHNILRTYKNLPDYNWVCQPFLDLHMIDSSIVSLITQARQNLTARLQPLFQKFTYPDFSPEALNAELDYLQALGYWLNHVSAQFNRLLARTHWEYPIKNTHPLAQHASELPDARLELYGDPAEPESLPSDLLDLYVPLCGRIKTLTDSIEDSLYSSGIKDELCTMVRFLASDFLVAQKPNMPQGMFQRKMIVENINDRLEILLALVEAGSYTGRQLQDFFSFYCNTTLIPQPPEQQVFVQDEFVESLPSMPKKVLDYAAYFHLHLPAFSREDVTYLNYLHSQEFIDMLVKLEQHDFLDLFWDAFEENKPPISPLFLLHPFNARTWTHLGEHFGNFLDLIENPDFYAAFVSNSHRFRKGNLFSMLQRAPEFVSDLAAISDKEVQLQLIELIANSHSFFLDVSSKDSKIRRFFSLTTDPELILKAAQLIAGKSSENPFAKVLLQPKPSQMHQWQALHAFYTEQISSSVTKVSYHYPAALNRAFIEAGIPEGDLLADPENAFDLLYRLSQVYSAEHEKFDQFVLELRPFTRGLDEKEIWETIYLLNDRLSEDRSFAEEFEFLRDASVVDDVLYPYFLSLISRLPLKAWKGFVSRGLHKTIAKIYSDAHPSDMAAFTDELADNFGSAQNLTDLTAKIEAKAEEAQKTESMLFLDEYGEKLDSLLGEKFYPFFQKLLSQEHLPAMTFSVVKRFLELILRRNGHKPLMPQTIEAIQTLTTGGHLQVVDKAVQFLEDDYHENAVFQRFLSVFDSNELLYTFREELANFINEQEALLEERAKQAQDLPEDEEELETERDLSVLFEGKKVAIVVGKIFGRKSNLLRECVQEFTPDKDCIHVLPSTNLMRTTAGSLKKMLEKYDVIITMNKSEIGHDNTDKLISNYPDHCYRMFCPNNASGLRRMIAEEAERIEAHLQGES